MTPRSPKWLLPVALRASRHGPDARFRDRLPRRHPLHLLELLGGEGYCLWLPMEDLRDRDRAGEEE